MSDSEDNNRSWSVDGSARYVTESGASRTHGGFLLRNVIARDAATARDMALNMYKAFLELKGEPIASIAWDGEPVVASFDPYIDR